MIAYKFFRFFLHLLVGLLTCALIFPWADQAGRDWCIKHWSIKTLVIFGVTLKISGPVPDRSAAQALIVANHISWLDIFVINSIHPCRFVTKSDVRTWPLIGWLCAKSGAIFIARGRLRDVRKIFEGLVVSIRAGERVAFFPEGTTSAQGGLSPFHANLFEAAIDAEVPIRPYALRYTDAQGRLHPAADFIGDMSAVQSMIAVFSAGKMEAELICLPIIETKDCLRRDLASAAQYSIASALGYIEERQVKAA